MKTFTFTPEHLAHFTCKWCERSWSIANPPAVRHYWFCPWCSVRLTPEACDNNTVEDREALL